MGTRDEERRNKGRFASRDAQISEIAARQHGVVHIRQLAATGLRPSGIRSRVARGNLHRVHSGVLAIAPPSLLSDHGHWLAAVMACGPGALLSHFACGAAHRIRPVPSTIDVTITRPGGTRRPGIRIHRVLPLDLRDYGRLDGIPCMSIPRVLLDLAPLIGQQGIERTIAEAQHRKLYDRAALVDLVERSGGRAGVEILRSVLAIHRIEETWTNRKLEERFLALTRRAGLPLPLVNHWVSVGTHSIQCDFVWEDARLIVETDGRDAHTRELQFEEDRLRDSTLKLAGWEVVRFTWRQVIDKPDWVISVVSRFREQRLSA